MTAAQVTTGRFINPGAANEVMVNVAYANKKNLAVGHAVPGVDLIQPPVSRTASSALARERVRAELGIAPATRVVLIVGGAWGVGNLTGAARVVDVIPGYHAIVVAARNESLERHLSNDRSLSSVSVAGWTERMPDLMAASDVLIQNAGGVTCLEAFSVRLPVLMFDPLPGHGEDNARQQIDGDFGSTYAHQVGQGGTEACEVQETDAP